MIGNQLAASGHGWWGAVSGLAQEEQPARCAGGADFIPLKRLARREPRQAPIESRLNMLKARPN